MDLRDGRRLGYAESGLADGEPVLAFLGTSQSSTAHLGGDAPRAAGVRLVLVDRPGYGASDLHPGRRLLDWPRDVAELADALDLERFAVLGMSGGGPHAAACAYALTERVSALGLVSSPAPVWDRRALRYSLPPHRQTLIELAGEDPDAAARRLLEDCRLELEQAKRESHNEDVHDPALRARLRASLLETAARGPEGYAQDLVVLFISPWGFAPEEIAVPTQIWHGDRDPAVPLAVAEFYAEAIPSSSLRVVPGAGHLLLWSHAEEILAALARR